MLQLFITNMPKKKKNYWIFLGNVTRHCFEWWNKWSLCQTSLMNVAEKTIHS